VTKKTDEKPFKAWSFMKVPGCGYKRMELLISGNKVLELTEHEPDIKEIVLAKIKRDMINGNEFT
jgi:hypothetical protein